MIEQQGLAVKCPRERLVALWIETNLCPEIAGHILRFVRAESLIPIGVVIDKGIETQLIGILLDSGTFVPSQRLINQVERSPSVVSADLIDHAGRSLFGSDCATAHSFATIDALGEISRKARRERLVASYG